MTTATVRAWLRHRRAQVRAESDRGSSVVEAVFIIPVIVILSMIVIQFALIWHGRHVAEAAAQSGAIAAAGYQAGTGVGEQTAQEYLTQVAPNLLSARSVTASSDATGVRVHIRAHVLTLVPFADFEVDESATSPVETFLTGGTP